LPERVGDVTAKNHENRIDPIPSSRRIVPCAKPRTKKPRKYTTISRSTVADPLRERPDIHPVSPPSTTPAAEPEPAQG